MTASKPNQEIAVITSASSGIGAATARNLARRGDHVLAGVRREQDADAIRGPNIEPLMLDITNQDHIQALATRVHEDPQGRAVGALINNAGVSLMGPVEVFPLDEWRRLFEVNFFGHMAVIQALLPALLRRKGRVGNISSLGGKVALATYAPYASTKFALEAASDALRREVAPLGVEVIVIKLAAVQTKIFERAIATAHAVARTMTPEQHHRYGGLVQAATAQSAAGRVAGVTADTAAEVIAEAATARTPRTRCTVGREAALLPLLMVLPDRVLDRALASALRPHLPTQRQ